MGSRSCMPRTFYNVLYETFIAKSHLILNDALSVPPKVIFNASRLAVNIAETYERLRTPLPLA